MNWKKDAQSPLVAITLANFFIAINITEWAGNHHRSQHHRHGINRCCCRSPLLFTTSLPPFSFLSSPLILPLSSPSSSILCYQQHHTHTHTHTHILTIAAVFRSLVTLFDGGSAHIGCSVSVATSAHVNQRVGCLIFTLHLLFLTCVKTFWPKTYVITSFRVVHFVFFYPFFYQQKNAGIPNELTSNLDSFNPIHRLIEEKSFEFLGSEISFPCTLATIPKVRIR